MKRTTGILFLAATVLFAVDWPQWRGPARDGVVPSFQEPRAWPEKLNRKWKIAVGQGHASPIYALGRIYVFSRRQNRETAASINPEDGKMLWSESYDAPTDERGGAQAR